MESGAEERRVASKNEDAEANAARDWSCKRVETTYEEARSVLEAQQTILAEIDEKAMRTVRTTVLLIGAIASTVKVANISLHTGFATLGAEFLFGSLAFGLVTYDETNPYLGPNRAYIDQLAANDFKETWETDLVEAFGYWIERNADEIDYNSLLLRITQGLLFFGMVFISLSLVL